MFDPKTKLFDYPLDTSGHYIDVDMDRGFIFDKDYPYIDKSKGFAFKRFWVRFLLSILVFPVAKIRMGLKVYGKYNLRKNKRLLKDGFISISNHVHFWDYICLMRTIRRISWPYVIVWNKNVNGKDGPLVRLVGGIPIPENDVEATLAFNKTIKEALESHHILHIYPEGSMWEYYAPIRPFHPGAASLAIKNNKPILPIGYSYRKPGWIRRKIFKQIALFNINIGEPLYPNNDLEKTAQLNDLTSRCHKAICELTGNNENLYEAIYNNSKRVDYY